MMPTVARPVVDCENLRSKGKAEKPPPSGPDFVAA